MGPYVRFSISLGIVWLRLIVASLLVFAAVFRAASADASTAPRCEALFVGKRIAPNQSAVLVELADLRVAADAAEAKGQREMARILYGNFQQLHAQAARAGVDLSDLPERIKAKSESLGAERREERRRDDRARENDRLLPWSIDTHVKANLDFSFSADGKHIAVPDASGAKIVDLESRVAVQSLDLSGPMNLVSFSPDNGKLVVSGELGHAFVIDVATGKTLASIESGLVHRVSWSSDGQRIAAFWAAGHRSFGSAVFDVGDGHEVLDLSRADVSTTPSTPFNVDGTLVAWSKRSGGAGVTEISTGKKRFSLPGRNPLFSADGSRVVTSKDNVIFVSDPRDGQRISEYKSGGDLGWKLVVSPDGGKTAVPNGLKILVHDTADGQRVYELKSDGLRMQDARFSADGKRLIGLGEKNALVSIIAWDLETGSVLDRVDGIPLDKTDSGLRIDGQGLHAAVGGFDGTVTVVDLSGRRGSTK